MQDGQLLKTVQATDAQYYMNTFGPRRPVLFVRGEGITLFDEDGHPYQDFFAGIATHALGYGHKAQMAAITEQIQTGILHLSNLFYNQPQAELAMLLVKNTTFDRAFITNSGTEATEGALKLARKFFYEKGDDRHHVVSANGSFHGRSIAAVAATGQEKYQAPYNGLLPTAFTNIPYNDIEAMRAAVSTRTCAVLLECILGEGGVIPAKRDYLQQVRKICDEYGALLVLDEVQTGMCRTGSFLCMEQYGIQADILTLAKGLGGGVPIGAILATEQIANAFAPGDHGSTFGGNPLVCKSAVAVVNTMLCEGIARHVKQVGDALISSMKAALSGNKYVLEVRGAGLLIGVELVAEKPVAEVVGKMFEAGYIVGVAANNTLRIAPPLIVTAQQCEGMLSALTNILSNGGHI